MEECGKSERFRTWLGRSSGALGAAAVMVIGGASVAGASPMGSSPAQQVDCVPIWGVSCDGDGLVPPLQEPELIPIDPPGPPATWCGSVGSFVRAGGDGTGRRDDQLFRPMGMAFHHDDLYIADAANDRVVRWSPYAETGTVVAGGNGEGAGLDQLDGPADVAVDAEGNVYVTEIHNDRVVRWAPGATVGTVVAGGNGRGDDLNQLNEPVSVALDPATGDLLVADQYNRRVLRFPAGSTSATPGTVVAGHGGYGTGTDQFGRVTGIELGADGSIYSLDAGNLRVMRFGAGERHGEIILDGRASDPSLNVNAGHLAVGDDGRSVFMADRWSHRVVRWDEGVGTTVVAGDGVGSGPAADLESPYSVALTPDGALVVADTSHDRVVQLSLEATSAG